MGGSQSQENVATAVTPSSSTPQLLREPVVHSRSSERSSTSNSLPELDIGPFFMPSSSSRTSSSGRARTQQNVLQEEEEDPEVGEEEAMEGEEDSTSALMTFHQILSRSLQASAGDTDFGDGATIGSQSENTVVDEDGEGGLLQRSELHSQESLSSSSSSSHHNHHHRHHHHHHRHHHNRHRHHHNHDGHAHDRRGHRSNERSRRRHTGEDMDSDPLGLGLSWTAMLQQRLHALQGGDAEEDGMGGAGHASSRSGHSHHHHHHHHQSGRAYRSRTSAPLFLIRPPDRTVSCPYCKKDFPSRELDGHKSVCKTKPRVQFNEDKLHQDSGECSICLEDMVKGDAIARLPCLCIYHIQCLKKWYERSQTCPAHPEMC